MLKKKAAVIMHLQLFALFLSLYFCAAQQSFNNSDIEGIRLRNSVYGEHAGRVEVLYNGTWGTICDDFWSYFDARIACGMLGYNDAVCAVSRAQFGRADLEVPIWMSNLQCTRRETALDQCSFSGWGENFCNHGEDAGVICRDESIVQVPQNVRVLNSTRTTITIRFNAVTNPLGNGITRRQYRISYQAEGLSFGTTRILFVSVTDRRTELDYTITRLTRDTSYTIQVRHEIRYRECFSYLSGNYSTAISARTSNQIPPSDIPVRLIPPATGLDFMGRLEVFHNGQWGTVCDDLFGFTEANVVCGMLNYTRAACSVSRSRLGRGTGQIWLDNVDCPTSAEVLDDCRRAAWGTHNCDHGDDVGVMCVPDDYPGVIQNLTVSSVSSDSVTLSWEPINFPSIATTRRYRIQYRRPGSTFLSSIFVSSPASSYTVPRLEFQTEYNFTIRAEVRFSYCFFTLSGQPSEAVSAMPAETAPSAAPASFHVTVLNCTALRAEWDLPPRNQRNGFIRGYKLMFGLPVGEETLVDVTGNETEYVINGLLPDTLYVVSVLAYTVADGPRSIHLSVRTNTEAACQTDIVNFFGLNGNGEDRATVSTFQRDLHIHCGTNLPGVQIDWFFSNGTKVSNNNRNIREGHFENGTTTLQIASNRRISLCDSDTYSCLANDTQNGRAERKTFKLTVSFSPPAPSRPQVLKVTDQSVTVAWDENECNGGHNLDSFTIRYSVPSSFFFRSYAFISGVRQKNYTITGLNPSSSYEVSVQAVSVDGIRGSYSASVGLTTLPPAPPAPQDVTVVLITPVVLKVTWVPPSLDRGNRVLYFTIYAFPLITQVSGTTRTRRQAANPLGTVSKNVSATETTSNITVHEQSVTYHVQVTATISTPSGAVRETDLSALSPTSTIVVPPPGLPVPKNVRETSTSNFSVGLAWDSPPPPSDPIKAYNVFYSAMIEGTSPGGTLVKFRHEGTVNTTANSITVEPLTPQSSYLFKISTITDRGQGAEYSITSETDSVGSDFERYVYFHVRFGPVFSCIDFRSQDIERKRSVILNQLIDLLRSQCRCNISPRNIESDAFSCGQLNHQIIYRGRILGTSNYSAIDLVELLQSWISTRQAFITIDSFRMQLDPTCTTRLDTIDDTDCPVSPLAITTTKATTKTTTAGMKDATTTAEKIDPNNAAQVSSVGAGEVGGIIIGVIIAVLLLGLILLIVGVVLWKSGKKTSRKGGNDEDDKNPFAEYESSTREEQPL